MIRATFAFVLSASAMAIAIAATIGYAINYKPLYDWGSVVPMAVPTVVAFVLLAFASMLNASASIGRERFRG